MLVHDLEYIEVTSTPEVKGGFAFVFAQAGLSTAAGINQASTSDITAAQSESGILPNPFVPGGTIGFNLAKGSAQSQSYSS